MGYQLIPPVQVVESRTVLSPAVLGLALVVLDVAWNSVGDPGEVADDVFRRTIVALLALQVDVPLQCRVWIIGREALVMGCLLL